ncbi:MAG: secondary thiamine-phosphate synthase enzyme YjbQ [Desulfosarcinaceae bacterium]|nr:secondary thiamine-phosphate synthase enzyme YjbQ [Desulfosarcinaceae bacterium]
MDIELRTEARTQMLDVTARIEERLHREGFEEGFCFLYVPHTTAAITINESADPAVKADILMVVNQLVPWEADYRHREGNSPAHVKASLFGASELIAVEKGRLVLGTWQGVFFCEFDGPRKRRLTLRLSNAALIR